MDNVPNGVRTYRNLLDAKIAADLATVGRDQAAKGLRLQGEVGTWIRDDLGDLIDYGRPIGPNGSIGDVDVETSKAWIEVTVQNSDKLKQIKRYLTNPAFPQKPVILFAPNYNVTPARDIETLGVPVLRTKEELLNYLRSLK